ncbi:hypothetical protein DDQ50_09400 [Amnibacterium flavum]|uniref:DNA mismatch repair protein n=1 Tax=Amnibacterium flavum TaxID=2173173 RepID=A0A2V1HV76_9MICO|nr:hypothetical protein DDQ50_09400 [Amnibacterium flavum]
MSGRLAAGLSFVQLNNGLWRITRADGSVLGYIDAPVDVAGARFSAKRLRSDRRSFFMMGDFRSFDEALECLRFS